jgi:hypothetical protein
MTDRELSLRLRRTTRALKAVLDGQVDATAQAHDGVRYTYQLRLVDARGAMGGLVIETCDTAVGTVVEVRELDAHLDDLARMPSPRLGGLLAAYRELARERDRIVGSAA